ncbi:MAG: C1 family peptidase [Saprospiraceae bacterium]
MKKSFFLFLFIVLAMSLQAQYQFTMLSDCNCTAIKNQQNTGTCWSFATSSFLESELIRTGKPDIDLSEMFFVRTNYQQKAENYMLRQGKAQFGQGGLAHDVINALKIGGGVPESVYSGKLAGDNIYDHSEMETALKGLLSVIVQQKRPSSKWLKGFTALMDAYMGNAPEQFEYNGNQYTPKSFAKDLGLNPNDYVNFTSYTHHPFYSKFVLEIPDNWSNGSFYNVPVDDLVTIAENAIDKGYSVAWDGDVSERGFSGSQGIAVLPVDAKRSDLFKQPGEELSPTQVDRQVTFENYSTTDDHLMHITGIAQDQNETRYFYVKNSWGEISPYNGYIYMSEPYFRLKTVSLLVHKNAVPASIRKKLGIR